MDGRPCSKRILVTGVDYGVSHGSRQGGLKQQVVGAAACYLDTHDMTQTTVLNYEALCNSFLFACRTVTKHDLQGRSTRSTGAKRLRLANTNVLDPHFALPLGRSRRTSAIASLS